MTERVDDVVLVVAARKAWPFYLEAAGYLCQPGRFFRPAGWMAFYAQRTIYPAVARIRSIVDEVDANERTLVRSMLSPDPLDRELGKLIRIARERVWNDKHLKAVLLSAQDDPETVILNGGKGLHHSGASAWTMGQRYTSLQALRQATTTDDLPSSSDA